MANPFAMIKHLVNALFDEQALSTITQLPLPNVTTGIVTPTTVTAGASYANGTTVQVDSGTGVTTNMWCLGITILNSATVTTDAEIDVGTGASGSESWQGTVVVKAPAGTAADQSTFLPFAVPIFLPEGVRVATRARGSAATAFDIALQVKTGMKPAD